MQLAESMMKLDSNTKNEHISYLNNGIAAQWLRNTVHHI